MAAEFHYHIILAFEGRRARTGENHANRYPLLPLCHFSSTYLTHVYVGRQLGQPRLDRGFLYGVSLCQQGRSASRGGTGLRACHPPNRLPWASPGRPPSSVSRRGHKHGRLQEQSITLPHLRAKASHKASSASGAGETDATS